MIQKYLSLLKKCFSVEIFRADTLQTSSSETASAKQGYKFLLAAIEFVFSSAFPNFHQPIAI